jgi:hypothetical protein
LDRPKVKRRDKGEPMREICPHIQTMARYFNGFC